MAGISRLQKLDYEEQPFKCRRCHEVGHIYKECQLLAKYKIVADPFDGNKGSHGNRECLNVKTRSHKEFLFDNKRGWTRI